jgi:hypothetical protein
MTEIRPVLSNDYTLDTSYFLPCQIPAVFRRGREHALSLAQLLFNALLGAIQQ